MKVVLKTLTNLSLIILVFVITGQSQNTRQKQMPVSNKQSVMREPNLDQQRAILLLDALYEKTKDFESATLKIRAQSQIADTLWLYDETRARQLFTKIFSTIDLIDLSNDKEEGKTEPNHSHTSKESLRHEVIEIVFRRDQAFAKQLLDSIKEKGLKEGKRVSVNDSQSGIGKELHLAIALAQTNPENAAEIVRKIITTNGYSEQVIPIIMEIRRKNLSLANDLYGFAMTAASKSAPSIIKIVSLAMYLLPNDEEQLYGKNKTNDPAKKLLMSQYVDFAYHALTLWIDTELNSTEFDKEKAEQDFAVLRQLILPLIENTSPDKAMELNARLTALAGARQIKKNPESLFDTDDIDSILSAAASSANQKQKDSLYTKAAMIAANKKDIEQAIAIAEKINNDKDKILVKSIIRYQAGLKALHKGNVDSAYNHAKEILYAPQRTRLFDEIARHLLKKKDIVRATEILNEIETWLDKVSSQSQKAEGLLRIAATVTSYDSIRGFETASKAVDAVNKADFSSDAEKDIENSGSLKVMPVTLEMIDFKSVFSSLTQIDFNKALFLAESLEKKEAAVMAQLAVCQETLKKEPQPLKKKSKKPSSKE